VPPNARFRSSDQHRRSTRLALTGALALSFWSSIGWTEPNAETQEPPPVTDSASRSAREHYDAGRKAYDRGEYEAAVTAFQAAHELTQAPALLFNIAQALRLAKRCSEALEYYRRFGEAAANELPSDFEDLRNQAERCAKEQAEPAEPELAKPPSTTTKRTEPSRISASHRKPFPQAGTNAPHDREAAITRDGWDWTRWTGLSCLGVAIASGVAGTVFTVRAIDAAERTSELSDRVGTDSEPDPDCEDPTAICWDEDAQANEEAGQRSARWATGLFIAAAVTGGAGLWLLLRPIESTPASSALNVSASPTGISMGWRSQF
jgi:tetratricopeptide (TPR) repeat protein